MQEYFATTPDPERGWALAALTGELSFAEAKPSQVRDLAMARVDPELFRWSWDFVGDLAETVALIWPESPHPPAADAAGPSLSRNAGEGQENCALTTLARTAGEGGPSAKRLVGEGTPALTEIIETLANASRDEVGAHLAPWLDALDATGRWALLKLVTGALRIGVSARLAKTALAEWSGIELDRIEEVWHGLAPPYREVFAWLDGRAAPPGAAELPTLCP